MIVVGCVIRPARACAAPPGPLLDKLHSLSGPAALDCGAIPIDADRDAAMACARNADAANKSWRLAFEIGGLDAHAWQGAVRDASGRMWVVYYDGAGSNRSKGGTGQASLGVLPCAAVSMAVMADQPIDCAPATGVPPPPSSPKRT